MDNIYLKKFDILFSNGNNDCISLKDILSRNDKTVLYFYPKDDTPGCTTEAKDFTCLKDKFKENSIQIVGVSRDSLDNHNKFSKNKGLYLDLISDPEFILHNHFGAYGEKNNYGKIVLGVIRSTFLINRNGEILKAWRNVKAKGHAQKLLGEIDNLDKK